MNKVIFGGSRKLGKLSKAIKQHADNIISQMCLVLVGDANGADRAMQEYLAEKKYPHVLVFCAGNTCRNNVGSWETRCVPTGRACKDFRHYAARDAEMIKEADYGFMVWDGKSKGTVNNIVGLVEMDKPVLVYFSPRKTFLTLKSNRDIVGLLTLCDRRVVELLDNSLGISRRIHEEQLQFNFT